MQMGIVLRVGLLVGKVSAMIKLGHSLLIYTVYLIKFRSIVCRTDLENPCILKITPTIAVLNKEHAINVNKFEQRGQRKIKQI